MPDFAEVSAADVAWVAGLFEGEGCIYIRPKGGVTVKVSMTDEDVVRRLHDLVGFGAYSSESRPSPLQDVYTWQAGARGEVSGFLLAISSWMGLRRRQKIFEALSVLTETKVHARAGERPCGTRTAYERHIRKGERPCLPCLSAKVAYNRGER